MRLLELMLERLVSADYSMWQQDEFGSEALDNPCTGLWRYGRAFDSMDVEPLTKLASYFAFVVLDVAAIIADQDLGLAEEVVPDVPVVAFVVPVVAFAVPVLALVVPVVALVVPATLDGPVDVFVVPAVLVVPVIPAGPVDVFAAPVVAFAVPAVVFVVMAVPAVANDEHVAVQFVALVVVAAEAVVVMPVLVVALDLVLDEAIVGVVVLADLVVVLVGVLVLVEFAVAFVQSLTSADSEVALPVFVVAYFVLPEQFQAFLSLEDLFVAADLALMKIFHPT